MHGFFSLHSVIGMVALGWNIRRALNILFSNAWGLVLREWKWVAHRIIPVLAFGLATLILSTFGIKL